MAKQAYEVFEFHGSSVRSQLARREGTEDWYTRRQYRDFRGYHWTAWESTSQRPYYKSNGDDPACWSETGSGWVRSCREPAIRLPRAA